MLMKLMLLYHFSSADLQLLLETVKSRRKTEITETVIFIKCCDLAKMP